MKKFLILLGDFDNNIDNVDDGQIMRNIEKIVIHPAYKHSNYDNDIALLKLDEPVAYSK